MAGLALMLGACAPTTMSPMLLRLERPTPETSGWSAGLRSGPHVSTAAGPSGAGFTFEGDSNPFALPQWSVAMDFALSYAFDDAWELHGGAQGELFFPLPVPAYGLYGGVSRRFQLGAVGITPSLCVRGATDFGISRIGGSSGMVGAEASVTVALNPDSQLAMGLAPFAQVQQVWTPGEASTALYVGAAAAARLDWALEGLELSAGFGRVFFAGEAWNSPILGIRLVR